MNNIPKGDIAMVSAYCLLVLFWFGLFVTAIAIFAVNKTKVVSRQVFQIEIAFLIVAGILAIDSFYWAIANLAHINVVNSAIEHPLRNPWSVAAVKFLVLISCLAFTFILIRTRQSLVDQLEDKHFGKFIDLTWDAIGILDSDGRVRFWNAGAERLFGWRREQVLGVDIRDFLVPRDLHDATEHALEVVRSKREAVRNMRTTRLSSDGRRIKVDITISPILDSGFEGFFGIMRETAPLSIADFGSFHIFGRYDLPEPLEAFAFVAMPFSSESVRPEVWQLAIREAVIANKLRAVRLDESVNPCKIVDQIFSYIRHATVVIVDLSGKNPNVFYELGLAHTLDKQVIQLLNISEEIPFDVAGIRTLRYDERNLDHLRQKLQLAIAEIVSPATPLPEYNALSAEAS